MSIQRTAWHDMWHDADTLSALSAEFTGWRIGRGGSGQWWAVRGNDLVRTPSVEELRVRLQALIAGGARG